MLNNTEKVETVQKFLINYCFNNWELACHHLCCNQDQLMDLMSGPIEVPNTIIKIINLLKEGDIKQLSNTGQTENDSAEVIRLQEALYQIQYEIDMYVNSKNNSNELLQNIISRKIS